MTIIKQGASLPGMSGEAVPPAEVPPETTRASSTAPFFVWLVEWLDGDELIDVMGAFQTEEAARWNMTHNMPLLDTGHLEVREIEVQA